MNRLLIIGALFLSAPLQASPNLVDLRPDLVGILYSEYESVLIEKRVSNEPQLKTLEYLGCYKLTKDPEWYEAAKRHFNDGIKYSDTDEILEKVLKNPVFRKYVYRIRKRYNRPSFFGNGLCGGKSLEATKF